MICSKIDDTKFFRHFSGYWVPGPAPFIQDEASLKLNSKQIVNGNERELHFTMAGMLLMLHRDFFIIYRTKNQFCCPFQAMYLPQSDYNLSLESN